jgi:hypothetical protein
MRCPFKSILMLMRLKLQSNTKLKVKKIFKWQSERHKMILVYYCPVYSYVFGAWFVIRVCHIIVTFTYCMANMGYVLWLKVQYLKKKKLNCYVTNRARILIKARNSQNLLSCYLLIAENFRWPLTIFCLLYDNCGSVIHYKILAAEDVTNM